MRHFVILAACIFSTSMGYSKELSVKKELLSDISAETKKCAVQIVSTKDKAKGSVIGFQSVCASLVIVSKSEAQIFIDGEWLFAKITESKESDGGDLDDLSITRSNGTVLAKKSNIAAFDSIVVAMAGGSDFKK